MLTSYSLTASSLFSTSFILYLTSSSLSFTAYSLFAIPLSFSFKYS
jgi:hypothetical protein